MCRSQIRSAYWSVLTGNSVFSNVKHILLCRIWNLRRIPWIFNTGILWSFISVTARQFYEICHFLLYVAPTEVIRGSGLTVHQRKTSRRKSKNCKRSPIYGIKGHLKKKLVIRNYFSLQLIKLSMSLTWGISRSERTEDVGPKL